MKKIIFLFCYFWAVMTALNAQDPLMYGKYNMSVPSQFNEAVFRDAPVAFEYKRLSSLPFLNENSTDVHTSHWLLVTHVLCSNMTLKVGDTVMITVHAGSFVLKLSSEFLFPLSDSIPGSEYRVQQTIVPAQYKTVDAGYTPIDEKGIVFCKQNTDIYPVGYRNCSKNKSFVLFYTALGLRSCLYDASLYGDITYWGMGDLKFREHNNFYDYADQYKKYNRKIIPDAVPCPQETTPPIIEKVSQPKKKGKSKRDILRKIGLLRNKAVDANLFVSMSNATVTGTNIRYLEFDILVRTDQTVRLGSIKLYLKFDANIFGLIQLQDTSRIKASAPSALQNKIIVGCASYSRPISTSPSDTVVITIGDIAGQVVVTNNTDMTLAHVRMKIQNCGNVSGLKFVKQNLSLQQSQYRFNTSPFWYNPYGEINFIPPNFRIATPNALYLCPPALCTLSPTTVRAGVGDWITLTPPAGTVLSANTYRVQFRDGDSNDTEAKIFVSDSVQFLTNPTRVRVKVPGCARRDSTALTPIFTGNAGKGNVFITPKTSDLPIFKSSVELNVEYSIVENVYEGGKHCRFNMANLANCAKIYKSFVLDTAVFRLQWGTSLKRDNVTSRVSECIGIWQTKINQLYPNLGINWDIKLGKSSAFDSLGNFLQGVCLISCEPNSAGNLISTTIIPGSGFLQNAQNMSDITTSIIGAKMNIHPLYVSQFSLLPAGQNIPFTEYDFMANILHEIGHTLGLNHVVTDTLDLMYPNAGKGHTAAQRESLISGSNKTISALQRQINDAKMLNWSLLTPNNTLSSAKVYQLGSTVPATPITIIPKSKWMLVGDTIKKFITVAGDSTKRLTITTKVNNITTTLQGFTYDWLFFDGQFRSCAANANSASSAGLIFNGLGTPTLSISNKCARNFLLKDTVTFLCKISDGCTIRFDTIRIGLPYVKLGNKLKNGLIICEATDLSAAGSKPLGGIFTCAGCPTGAFNAATNTITPATLTAPVTFTYSKNGCSASFTVTKKPGCRACPGFTITNANNICISNNQNTSDVVAYNLDGTGCPPIGTIVKAEMIPSTTASWANRIVIGQTTNQLIDIPITIQGAQSSGTYLVRVAIYTAAGVLIEASINTKTIQIGRPTTTVLGYNCTLITCTTCGGGSGNGTGRSAPTNNFTDGEVYLYPNPTADRFTLQTPEYDAATEVSISDTQGRLITKQNVYTTTNEIETHELPNGVYYVRIAQGERSTVLKLVIMK